MVNISRKFNLKMRCICKDRKSLLEVWHGLNDVARCEWEFGIPHTVIRPKKKKKKWFQHGLSKQGISYQEKPLNFGKDFGGPSFVGDHCF
jgi:hypothetical protein